MSQDHPGTTATSDNQKSASTGAGAAARERQAESRDAGEEEKDETAAFKQSASVRLLARVTGLSLQRAYWLAVLLNFGVIAAIILWISRSKLPAVFRDRTASIQKAMEEARKASQEAKQRLSEIEARLSKLDVEIGAMQSAADQEAGDEEARIKAAADEDARRIIDTAQQEIGAAAKTALRELKAFAADLAVGLAQKQIRVDSSTDKALVRGFASQLGTAETNGPASGKDGH
ncbi:MAG TPA: ATP synthase F0 subunit B [Terriglobales bacterium]